MTPTTPLSLPVIDLCPASRVPDFVRFATYARPLRPSKAGKFLQCPMSVVLTMHEDKPGGRAAQTGNIVHDAAEAYHNAKGDRVAAGLAALEAARAAFPEGDPEKAKAIFARYAADPENQNAVVLWCEAPVRLVLAPAPFDPTGEPVVIEGTLDQVRKHKDGRKRVWDIKNTYGLKSEECHNDYTIQQAVYTLAARQTLDPEIEPGGFIYTPAYEKTRAKAFLPLRCTVADCMLLVSAVVTRVALVRMGIPEFRPSADACQWCSVKPWPDCKATARGLYGLPNL